MSIIDNNLIGLYFLPPNLKVVSYEIFLRAQMYVLLEDLSLDTRQNMLYSQDVHLVHYIITERE